MHEDFVFPAKATIWDLDDTIGKAPHYEAWEETFKAAGVKEFTPQKYARYVAGRPVNEGLCQLLNTEGICVNEERLNELAVFKQNLVGELIKQNGVDTFPSSIKIMKELNSLGVKIAVASSSANALFILEQCYTLDQHGQRVSAGLLDIVEVIIADKRVITKHGDYIDLGIKGKPAPDIFQKACEELYVKPEEVLGFEDAISGINAFKSGGIKCIGLNRTGIKEELIRAGADAVFDDLSQTNIYELANIYSNQPVKP